MRKFLKCRLLLSHITCIMKMDDEHEHVESGNEHKHMKKNIKISELAEDQKKYIKEPGQNPTTFGVRTKMIGDPKELDNVTKSRAGVMVEGHFKIYDPETGEVFIGQRDIQGGDGP